MERAPGGLVADFGGKAAGLDDLPRLDAKLLVDFTELGMHPNVNATPVPAESIKPGMVVFDTIYNPAETLLLKQAKARDAEPSTASPVFVNQPAAQFHLFTGQQANTALMRKAVIESLHTR